MTDDAGPSGQSSPLGAPSRQLRLGDLVRREAPLPPRRAAAVLVPVARELVRTAHGIEPDVRAVPWGSDRFVLHADGTAELVVGAPRGPLDPAAAGATLGRLLFELLVGRAPVSTEDAFEPHVRRVLDPATVALVARSCSTAPGQWPDATEWCHALEQLAGPQAPPEPPALQAARRRRRQVLVAVFALLVVLSVAVVLMAPRWWDAATEDGAAVAPAVGSQPLASS